ncbi:MAG: protein kinase [Spirochaetales bacterium]|nr:protein kinase [Spirochaetales bacterium]
METQVRKIGNYTVRDVIGQGGMGKIFKAIDPKTKETVIIKQLMITEKTILEKRFQREADIMSAFDHPNIVKVYKQFSIGKSWYITMEFIDGISLDGLIKKAGRLSNRAAMLILLEICEGLKYAHNNDVIHRDIKPDNVLISKSGEVKLCDFGIATARPGNDEGLTNTGVIMGTPAYMSPEQLMSSKHVDKRSDIYSTGVMFYQMVTGEQPFPGSFTADSIAKIRRGKYTKPHRLNRKIPGYFKKIIRKMMHCKKEKRFDDLQRVINILKRHSAHYRDKRARRRAIRDFLEGKESGKKNYSKQQQKELKEAKKKAIKAEKEYRKQAKAHKKLKVVVIKSPPTKKTPERKQSARKSARASAKKSPVRKPARKPAVNKASAKAASAAKKASAKASSAAKKSSAKAASAARKSAKAKYAGKGPAAKGSSARKAKSGKASAKAKPAQKAAPVVRERKLPNARETFRAPVKMSPSDKKKIAKVREKQDAVCIICRQQKIPINRSFQIGRDSTNKIVLQNDPQVSRTHAQIIKSGKSLYLVDRSSNGTSLNGKRVNKNQKIRIYAGDIIKVGRTLLKFK